MIVTYFKNVSYGSAKEIVNFHYRVRSEMIYKSIEC